MKQKISTGELETFYGDATPKEADHEINLLVQRLYNAQDTEDVIGIVDDFLGREGKIKHLMTLKLLHLAAKVSEKSEAPGGMYV